MELPNFESFKKKLDGMSGPIQLGQGVILEQCLNDAALKLGGGIVLGSISSLLLFKRRSWPMIYGSGFACGQIYHNYNEAIRCASQSDAILKIFPKDALVEIEGTAVDPKLQNSIGKSNKKK